VLMVKALSLVENKVPCAAVLRASSEQAQVF
jgi:hypothetical protein